MDRLCPMFVCFLFLSFAVVLHYQVLNYNTTDKLYLIVTDVVGRIGRRIVLYPLFVPEDLKQR